MNTKIKSKWFPHDVDACDDPKLMLLITQLDWEGFGLYWMLIQRLCKEEEYCIPLNLIDSISRVSQVSKEKLEAIITKFGLFEIEGEYFYSPSLIRRMEPLTKKTRIYRNNAIEGWKKRRQFIPPKNAIALQLQSNGNEHNITQHNTTQHNRTQHNIKLFKEEKKEGFKSESKNDSDPLSFFSEDILKLYNWCVKGKLPNSKESVFPEISIPKTKKEIHDWMKCIHDLVNIDGYTLRDVNRAIIYAREDQFWKDNFLSLRKLRRRDKDKIRYIDRFLMGWNKDNKDKPLPGEDTIQMMMRQMKEKEELEENSIRETE
jgi:hypothetical protein